MEPLFQNRYIVTLQNVNEFSRKATPLWNQIFLPLLALLIGCGMYLVTDELHEIVIGGVIGAYFLVLYCMQSQRAGKTLYARYTLNRLDTLERVVEFSDIISVYSPGTGGRNIYGYENVYKFYESKNLYILMLPFTTGLFLEKGKFTIGNEAEFKAFLKSRCVHLQNKKF